MPAVASRPPCWSPPPMPLRCAASSELRIELDTGIVSLIGPNGAGKTNFLEALYFALTGRSFRTGDRRDLIPFGGSLARAEALVRDEDGIERTAARVGQPQRGPPPPARRQPGRPGDAGSPPPAGRRLLAGPPGAGQGPAGRAPRPPRRLRRRPLALALGAAPALRPGARPAQRAARPDRRRRGGAGELDAWDASLAEVAAALTEARAEAVARARPGLRRGRRGARARRRRRARVRAARRAAPADELRSGLAERRDADLRLGRSSWGPHLDELKLWRRGPLPAPLRLPGRAAAGLLALIFAEREALMEARRVDAAAAARRRDERARPRTPRAAGGASRRGAARR